MTVRTLAEAAAEVLNATRNGGMAFQKGVNGTDVANPLSAVVDLGGATYDNPSGDKTGVKTAAARMQATPPKGPAVKGMERQTLPKQPQEELNADQFLDKDDRDTNPSAGEGGGKHAPKGRVAVTYAKPVGEEVEIETDEEIIEDDEVVEEDNEVVEEEAELTQEEIDSAKAERMDRAKVKMQEKHGASVKEDIDALFSGETLTEEFKTKAATIFEAAVLTRAVDIATELEDEILASAEEALNEARTEIEDQVDAYLNFVVENWVKENQVAIESGLKSEMVEDFITGLKNLFSEHYIDVPAEKADVVSDQAEQIAALEAKVNETLNANIELTKKLNESTKTTVLSTVCEGLTATQAAKVKTLAEGVEFTTEGEYAKKLGVVRESYFASGKVKQGSESSIVALTESESPAHVEEEEVVPASMSAYVTAISRTQK